MLTWKKSPPCYPEKKFSLYRAVLEELHSIAQHLSFSHRNKKHFIVSLYLFLVTITTSVIPVCGSSSYCSRSTGLSCCIFSDIPVSLDVKVAVHLATSVLWRIKELFLSFCLSSFSLQRWRWWLPWVLHVGAEATSQSRLFEGQENCIWDWKLTSPHDIIC